ncbi:MAG: CBS domain-containing protein [Archaeoglobaceae archaeon]|nr:CBS domain-containing protein [Archaeoglobaceae archaeon]
MEADLPVKEIMTREVCVEFKDTSLLNASRKMIKYGVGSIVVVENGKPVGIVTEKDLIEKVISRNKIPSEVKLKDIMSYPLITITPSTSLMEAARIMLKKGIRRLPVVDGMGNLVGIVTDNDILRVSIDIGELTRLIIENSVGYSEELYGKCEKCGKFTDKLIEHNGLRICEDCFESYE